MKLARVALNETVGIEKNGVDRVFLFVEWGKINTGKEEKREGHVGDLHTLVTIIYNAYEKHSRDRTGESDLLWRKHLTTRTK